MMMCSESGNTCYTADTPGVMAPSVASGGNAGLKLALCNTVASSSLSSELVADFLLWHLNKSVTADYLPLLGPSHLHNLRAVA